MTTVKSLRIAFCFILVVSMVLGLAASGLAEDKPTIVASRWAGPHADDQKAVCQQYTDAVIKIDDIDYGNLKQKQITSMSSSADYDLVWASEVWLPEYVSKGWLMPLDEFVKNNGTDLSAYSAGMVAADTFDGKLYALPTFAQTLILTVNKEWFDREGQKIPATVDELIATAKYFKEKGTGIAIPATQGQAACDLFAQLLYSAGGDYFDEGGKLNLTSAEAVRAMTLYKELCTYSMDGSATWHHDQVSEAVRTEKAPFGITVTGLSGLDSDPEQSAIVEKVAYAPIPGDKLVAGCVSYWSWAVAANSKNPEAAYKFAAWLVSPATEKAQTLMNGQITAVSALATDADVVAKTPFLPAASETLANAKTQPTSSSAAAIFEPLAATLSQVATTDVTAEDALKALQEQLKDVTK
jgi:ABC-type glycerol-3-phosphate transport system substrate-binding protein